MAPLVVGFDLDMTLIDSRPGIAAAFRALVAETGVDIDIDAVVGRLGPPLEVEIANWFPASQVPSVALAYRRLYPRYAIEPTTALPGAYEALEAVRKAGGKVVVVTAKKTELARLHLERLGLTVDGLAGLAWADGKVRALAESAASVYVGDHVADIAAARSAGAVGVGVATGPCTVEELRHAGAETVLTDLNSFASWLGQGLAW
jgi:phosphoglycolate phosphatase